MKKKARIVIWMGILMGILLLICGSAAAEGKHPAGPDYAGMMETLQRKQEAQKEDGPRRGAQVELSQEGTVAPDETLTFTATVTGVSGTSGISYLWGIQDDGRDPNGWMFYPNSEGLTSKNTIQYHFYSAGNYSVYVEAYQNESRIAYKTVSFTIADDDIHPTLEDKVSEIVNNHRGSSDWETALNLHDWLTHNAYYDYSYDMHGADMLFSGLGVCDSYSKDYLLLLEEADIPVRRVISANHAWNAVQLDGQWYFVDATWDDSDPDQVTVPVSGYEGHDYFCINHTLITGILDQGAQHSNSHIEGNGTNPQIPADFASVDASWPIHTGEWRSYGLYWDGDEQSGEIRDYKDLFIDTISSGTGSYTISADHEYPVGGYYFSPSDDYTVMLARYYYAWGLSKNGFEAANGNLLKPEISYNLDAEHPAFTIAVNNAEGEEQPAEDGIVLRYGGTRLADGDAVGGKIQYKFYVENLPAGCTELEYGWDVDMSATTPGGGWVGDWRPVQTDEGGTYFYIMPDLMDNYNSEIMFVRTGPDAPVRRVALYYNRTPELTDPLTFTNAEAPRYQEENYTLTWSAAEGEDFYFVVWKKPDGEAEWRFAGEEGLALDSIPGATDQFGGYAVTVFAIGNDRILQKSGTWTFEISMDPVLQVDPSNNAASVTVDPETGAVTAPMHQWINFDVTAPGSNGVEVFWLYTDPATLGLTEAQSLHSVTDLPDYAKYADCWPGDGWDEFTWTMIDAPDSFSGGQFTVYIVAEGHYENWTKHRRAVLPVTITVNSTISGNITYTVPSDLNTFEEGIPQVARDGELIIEVDNANNDADFYGAYIPAEDSVGSQSARYWDWIADSHWATKTGSTGTTQVQLPVPRCAAGQEYEVHVYAVKFGALQTEAAATTKIHVVDAVQPAPDPEAGEVILSMKDSYQTGERLMIHAAYLQPETPLHNVGWMDVQIYPVDEPWHPIYEKGGDWDDFYDVDEVIWEGGEYTVLARAMASIDGRTVTLAQSPEKTITVQNTGTSVPPTIPADYSVTNQAFAEGETFAINLPVDGNDTEEIYFAELYGTWMNEDGPEIDNERFIARAERDADGDFTFRMGWRNGQVQPGTYAVIFGSMTPGMNRYYDFDHQFFFDVRMNPVIEIEWRKADNDDYDYEIPVHTDFTVRINAYGATEVLLDMGGGYDPNDGKVDLRWFEEWWDGSWGENHERIRVNVAYDESCSSKGAAYFPMKALADYGCPDEGETRAESRIVNIYCSSEGAMDVHNWEPVGYYRTDEDGNVYVCSGIDPEESAGWTQVSEDGLTIARGKLLTIMDLAASGRGIGSDGFFGALMGIDGQGRADWEDVYDRNIVYDEAWLTLSTARAVTNDASGTIQAALWLSTWKEGYDTSEKVYPITITDAKEPENERVFWSISGADPTTGNVTAWTHDRIRVQVYVPGAEEIEIIAMDEKGDDVYRDGCGGDLYVNPDWQMGKGCTLTLKAFARSENGGETEYTYPGMITILSRGELPAPSVTITNAAADGSVPEGQDVQFTFAENSELETFFTDQENKDEVWYNAYLWDEYGNEVRDPLREVQAGTNLRFPTDRLEAGTVYRLGVEASLYGYTSVTTDVWFLLKPETDENAPTARLEILDDTVQDGSVLVNQDVAFGITAEDAKITGVSLYNGHFWMDFNPDEGDDGWETRISFDDARTYPVVARVDLEGSWEPVLTNVIYITATKNGETGGFSYSTSLTEDGNGSRKATRGEPFTVTYTNADNADHYWVEIEEYDPRWKEWNWADQQGELYTDGTAGGTGTVLTAKLEAGKDYRLFARADAIGYTRTRTPYTYFTVNEPTFAEDETHILLRVVGAENGTRTIQTGGQLAVSAYAPGAEWINLLYDTENSDDWQDHYNGESFSTQVRPYWNAETYQMVARAWYPVLDEYGQPVMETNEAGEETGEKYDFADSAPVTITVNAEGTVSITEPELPAYLAPGSGLAFTVPMIEDGDWMNLQIRVAEGDGWQWDDPIYQWNSNGRELSAAISWDELEEKGIQCGHTLILQAGGGKPGYDVRGWERSIPIIDLGDEDVPEAILSIDEERFSEGETNVDENGVYHVPVNTEIPLTVQPKKGRTAEAGEANTIQEVRLFDGRTFRPNGQPDGRDGIFRTFVNSGHAETITIYAMVTYTPLDEAWDELDDDPRQWYPTNALQITYTSEGSVNPFTISVNPSPTTVERGGKIQVTIQLPVITEDGGLDAGNNATDFHVEIENTETDWRWTKKNDTAEIATTNLRPGEYRLRAVGYAHGLENYLTRWQPITITEPEMGGQQILFTVNGRTPEEAKNDPIRIWLGGEIAEAGIIAPGATKIGFIEDGNAWHLDSEENYFWGEADSWYNNEGLYYLFEDDAGPHTLKACAWFDAEEGWVYSEPITVTVIRKEGSMAFDSSAIPAYFIKHDENHMTPETFTILMPENADYMNITLRQAWETAEEGWAESVIDQKDRITTDYEAEIPANRLAAGQEIWIDAEAYGIGYPRAELSICAKVLEAPDEQTLILPGALTTIEDSAFEGGSFSAVVIPDGVTSIGHDAFNNCPRLVYVSYPATLTIDSDVIADSFGGGTNVLVWDPRPISSEGD